MRSGDQPSLGPGPQPSPPTARRSVHRAGRAREQAPGGVRRSRPRVTIPPGLAAELALADGSPRSAGCRRGRDPDPPGRRCADRCRVLFGLVSGDRGSPDDIRSVFLNADARPEQITTSLLVPLAVAADGGEVSVALILYAETPGAFIDLAADLAWITGRPPEDFALDEHRSLPTNSTARLTDLSSINQALGVLIERGFDSRTGRARVGHARSDGRHRIGSRPQLSSLPRSLRRPDQTRYSGDYVIDASTCDARRPRRRPTAAHIS